jgi:arabinose-5-phosphate isomerase
MTASSSSVLRRARQVLEIEAQAVRDQLRHLDAGFSGAVQSLHAATERGGQIVVMGIGKSGLVGRKIAATLSSTGSPAVFFHPAEGLHGDLGMIRPRDGVLALSASGETEEIRKILPLLKEKGLVLVAMTSERKSRLARAADHVVCSHVRQEACPLNLAPTASTTAMLALGDALAMALMERKGFKPSDFARLHPGGSLGKRLLLTVKDLMRTGRQNPVVRSDRTVQEALLEMTRTRLGATHVVDAKGFAVGFFTDGDLRRHLQKDALVLKSRLALVMTKNPKTIRPEQSLHEALEIIKAYGFDNLPVVDGKGRPVGILDERDLLSEGVV